MSPACGDLQDVIRGRGRESAVGVVSVISKFTAACAPLILGYIIQFVSEGLPFVFAAGLQFASAAPMNVLFKGVRPLEEASSSQADPSAS